VALLAGLFLASPAHAVRGWYPPVQLGEGSGATVEMNSSGFAAAVWFGASGLQASVRTAGSWSEPHDVGPGPGSLYHPPALDVDSTGNVVVVWEGPDHALSRRGEAGFGRLATSPGDLRAGRRPSMADRGECGLGRRRQRDGDLVETARLAGVRDRDRCASCVDGRLERSSRDRSWIQPAPRSEPGWWVGARGLVERR
jgi:hypothetical protein